MTIKEKMHNTELYLPFDKEIFEEQTMYLDRLYDFNNTRPTELDKRERMLKEMFAEIGDGCYIEPPFHSNWGGHHVHFGKNVYANFNLTLVDDTHIYVGDYTKLGPNVTIAAAGHPILPELREQGYQYNAPVFIGKNCWLGAGVIVVPGVTVGDNSVIGAGSVVTKDIPSNVVAVGNPCRVLREINEHDREYYFKDRKIKTERIIKSMENKYLLSSLDLVEDVFAKYKNPQEGKIVRRLVEEIRSKKYYIPELELIAADENDEVIGYAMFSRFHIEGRYENELLLLTPVAVKTELQRRHISKDLIEYGFEKAKELNFKAILVEGNPKNYNPRGFRSSYEFGIKAGPNIKLPRPECLMIKELEPGAADKMNGIADYSFYETLREG